MGKSYLKKSGNLTLFINHLMFSARQTRRLPVYRLSYIIWIFQMIYLFFVRGQNVLHSHNTVVIRIRIILLPVNLDFYIVNFPFLDGDLPGSTSYGVYISQLIRFARVSSHIDDLNTRNKVLTAKLLRQEYRCHKLRKAY